MPKPRRPRLSGVAELVQDGPPRCPPRAGTASRPEPSTSLTWTTTRLQALAPGSRPHPKPWQPQPSRAAEQAQDVGTVALGYARTTTSRQQSMELCLLRQPRDSKNCKGECQVQEAGSILITQRSGPATGAPGRGSTQSARSIRPATGALR
jgi:hypothetical protein